MRKFPVEGHCSCGLLTRRDDVDLPRQSARIVDLRREPSSESLDARPGREAVHDVRRRFALVHRARRPPAEADQEESGRGSQRDVAAVASIPPETLLKSQLRKYGSDSRPFSFCSTHSLAVWLRLLHELYAMTSWSHAYTSTEVCGEERGPLPAHDVSDAEARPVPLHAAYRLQWGRRQFDCRHLRRLGVSHRR